MNNIKLKNIFSKAVFFGFTVIAFVSLAHGQAGAAKQVPELPPSCGVVQVPAGNKPSFHTYASGVQIYRWSGTAWTFVAPAANLFADANFRGRVGTHYGGPTWESNSGSLVVAAREDGCTPEPTAIPWLLLKTVSTEGNGIFANTTYIQRVNTAGGLAPTTAGSSVGAEARVPYTAEYYFYRAEN
jgi:hypothetical protein